MKAKYWEKQMSKSPFKKYLKLIILRDKEKKTYTHNQIESNH